jgi:hypothetical protein
LTSRFFAPNVVVDVMSGKQRYIYCNEAYFGSSYENYPNGNIRCVTDYIEGYFESKTRWDEKGNKIPCN